MADVVAKGEGAERAAETMLRVNGGRTVLLRLPATAAVGDVTEELGLAAPQFQDAEIAPAVFRKLGSTATLLVSAGAVKTLVGSLQFDSDVVLFEDAAGVVVDGVVYGIERVVADAVYGTVVRYSVTLRAPVA